MAFIDGFLSLASVAGSGSVVEMGTQPRQPISFALTTDRHPISGAYGLARNVAPVRFTYEVSGLIAGLGIFSSPTGGALLLALPFATPRPIIGGGQAYAADDGAMAVVFDALATNPNPASEPNQPYSGGETVGSWWDAPALGALGVVPGPGAYVPPGGYLPAYLNSAAVTAGIGLVLQRGVLNIQI